MFVVCSQCLYHRKLDEMYMPGLTDQEEWDYAKKAANEILEQEKENPSKTTSFKISKKKYPQLSHSFLWVNGELYRCPIKDVIGKGAFGKVILAQRENGDQIAVKVEKLVAPTQKILEIKMQQDQDEASINAILGRKIGEFFRELEGAKKSVHIQGDASGKKYDVTKKRYLLLQKVPGINLKDYLQMSILTKDEELKLALKLCNCIKVLHDKKIIHGDIHENNFLVHHVDGKEAMLTLIDFGNAIVLKQDENYQPSNVNAFHQTRFQAPEIKKKGYYKASDIYALAELIRVNLPQVNISAACFLEDPTKRPNINELMNFIRDKPLDTKSVNVAFETDPSGYSQFVFTDQDENVENRPQDVTARNFKK